MTPPRRPYCTDLTDAQWRMPIRTLAVFLNGQAISSPDPRGERVVDDSFLLLFNASHEDHSFTLPDGQYFQQDLIGIAVAIDPEALWGKLTTRNMLYGGNTLAIAAKRDSIDAFVAHVAWSSHG